MKTVDRVADVVDFFTGGAGSAVFRRYSQHLCLPRGRCIGQRGGRAAR
jgi:hypothetical protein